jgi:uncharacterized protein (DUF433 family)
LDKNPPEIKYFDAKDYDKVIPKPQNKHQNEKIIFDFPDLTKEQIQAAIEEGREERMRKKEEEA